MMSLWFDMIGMGLSLMNPTQIKNVHCKVCGKDFDRMGWLTNKQCEMGEQCRCPEVKKAVTKANEAINKAKHSSTVSFTKSESSSTLPTQHKEGEEQHEMNVHPIVMIEIKKNRGRK
jgi:hypothetical protein